MKCRTGTLPMSKWGHGGKANYQESWLDLKRTSGRVSLTWAHRGILLKCSFCMSAIGPWILHFQQASSSCWWRLPSARTGRGEELASHVTTQRALSSPWRYYFYDLCPIFQLLNRVYVLYCTRLCQYIQYTFSKNLLKNSENAELDMET